MFMLLQIVNMLSDLFLVYIVYSLFQEGSYLLCALVLFVWFRVGFFISWRPSIVKKYFENVEKIKGKA